MMCQGTGLRDHFKFLWLFFGDFSRVEQLANTILGLPIYPELEDIKVEHVIVGARSFAA